MLLGDTPAEGEWVAGNHVAVLRADPLERALLLLIGKRLERVCAQQREVEHDFEALPEIAQSDARSDVVLTA